MDLEYRPNNPAGRSAGIGLVVVLHLVIGWGLVTGLARQAVEIIKKPVEMRIVDELQLPPPPPPPPPKELKVADKPLPTPAEPPPYVPPPDVQPAVVPVAPVIQAMQQTPPEKPVEIAPPTPPAPPAPSAPLPAPAVPTKTELALVCPGHREALQGALSDLFDRYGVEGVLQIAIRFKGSEIVDIKQLAGPREYFRDVSRAVRRLDCKVPAGAEITASLDIVFKDR